MKAFKIQIKPSHRGLLHEHLHVAPTGKIPVGRLEAAKKKGGTLGKEATFALNARQWAKK